MMIQSFADLRPIAPEVVLLVSALGLMMLDAFIDARRRGWMHVLSIIALFATAFALSIDLGFYSANPFASSSNMLVRDGFGDVLKFFILLTTAIVLVYGRHHFDRKQQYFGNFYVLILFAVLGMMILVSAGNLVTIYLGLELMALATYALVALDRDNGVASEVAMKYFVLGAIASGMLLYGMSILYGLSGSLDLIVINQAVSNFQVVDGNTTIALWPRLLALCFVVIGIAFKFGAVPFHMWMPDVYEGSPTPMTAFIAAVPKIAAVGMAVRLLPQGLPGLLPVWQEVLGFLALGSLILGNLAAIAQYNLKRMLAYSTISHVGFMFLGLIQGGAVGLSALTFYVIVYALTTAAAFGVIVSLARDGLEFDRIDDYKGLNQRNPWLALLMLIVMASLAGIPPLIGFWAKFQVLAALVSLGAIWKSLVVVAAVFAVIGAYYYLRVIKVMYFDAPENDAEITPARDVRWILSFNVLTLAVLGVYAEPLLGICRRVFGLE
jgi:NADH-quinone oxidoreductase subunit N